MSILAWRHAERIMPPPEPADLAERVREELRRVDAVPVAGVAREPRLLTAHEGYLPAGLPDPYGPDPVVFGPRYTLPDGNRGGTGAAP